MLHTALNFGTMFTSPHRDATYVGKQVLEAGGTAMEAMIAAAAMIAVVYPHMNGIGGDGFWLVHRPGELPLAIAACGQAASMATPEWYGRQGHFHSIPSRGGLAALTVPGTVGGWDAALELVEKTRAIPVNELLEPAVKRARRGVTVTANQASCTADKLSSLQEVTGFADAFLIERSAPIAGATLKFEALANTIELLGQNGLRSFYDGDLAFEHGKWLGENGSPIRREDFQSYRAAIVEPLSVKLRQSKVFNLPPPTQGISSLMILGLFDRLAAEEEGGFDHIHGLVEATKRAFLLRNRHLGDPDAMVIDPRQWITPEALDVEVRRINVARAQTWPHRPAEGDTIWMGAADIHGNVVSFIQSVFWEFGSGLTCPTTGVSFQNRGSGFSLGPGPNQLQPGKRPFHTLNPAMAFFDDGRVMAYGTMGGEGQPQTQAAVFTRYARYGMSLQESVTAPRWLLGKTWGDDSTNLKVESRLSDNVLHALANAGHDIEVIEPFSDLCGHAGAVVSHVNGLREGAADPRSDGAAF